MGLYLGDLRNWPAVGRGVGHSIMAFGRGIALAGAEGRLVDHSLYTGGRIVPDVVFGMTSGGVGGVAPAPLTDRSIGRRLWINHSP